MTCPMQSQESSAILLDYAAGRLARASARAIEEHVGSCPRCATFLEEQGALWAALDAWEAPPISAEFNRRLWRRVDAAKPAPWYLRFSEQLRCANWRPGFTASAAALILGAALIIDHAGTIPQAWRAVQAPPAYSVSATEADQVEQTLDDIQLLHQFDTAARQARSHSEPM